MRGLLFGAFALCVMGLAYWAYYENYKTQDALRTASALQREIGIDCCHCACTISRLAVRVMRFFQSFYRFMSAS